MQSDTNVIANKQTIFSGIQPSGAMTIGNFLGAVRNWIKLQDDYNCTYCVVDMHAITVRQIPADLRKNTYDALAMLLALGINPNKSTIFVQSHVHEHAELAWALNCLTYFGEASRMTQFKDKSAKRPDAINLGLFTYPTLMAADILLYQANLVPIGADQKQHLELARDLAMRFNSQYSETFTVPEGYIGKKSDGARIMSLTDPSSKMSKSDPSGAILLTDTPQEISNKFKKSVTDSLGIVKFDEANQPGLSNLLTIYAGFSNSTPEAAAEEFSSLGYGEIKKRTAEAVISALSPIQNEFKKLLTDKGYLDTILTQGREKASYVARRTLSKVYKKIGFVIPNNK